MDMQPIAGAPVSPSGMDKKRRPYPVHMKKDDPPLLMMASLTMTSQETDLADTTDSCHYYSDTVAAAPTDQLLQWNQDHSSMSGENRSKGVPVAVNKNIAINIKSANNSHHIYGKQHNKKRGSVSSKISKALFRERRSSHVKMVRRKTYLFFFDISVAVSFRKTDSNLLALCSCIVSLYNT